MKAALLALPLAAFLSACASSSTPAHAGEWRLNPRLCADLREDVRDSRVNHGPRDRAEDRIDRQYINCPASAFVWVGDNVRVRPSAPQYQRVYIDKRGQYYGVTRKSNIKLNIVVR